MARPDYDELRRLCAAAHTALLEFTDALDKVAGDAAFERDQHNEWSGLMEIHDGIENIREQVSDAHDLVCDVEDAYHGDND